MHTKLKLKKKKKNFKKPKKKLKEPEEFAYHIKKNKNYISYLVVAKFLQEYTRAKAAKEIKKSF